MTKNKKFLIILSIILSAMIIDWIYLVNLFAVTYENNDVSLSIENHFKNLNENNYTLTASIYKYDNKIYTEEELGNFIQKIYGDIKNINISKQSGNNDNTISYNVYNSENNYISTIIANKTGEKDLFKIDKYTLTSNDLEKYNNPTIKVPEIINEIYIKENKFSNIIETDHIKLYKELKNSNQIPKYNIISLGEFAVLNEDFKIKNAKYNFEIVKNDINSYEMIIRPKEENQEFYNNLVEEVATTYSNYIAKDTSLYTLRKKLYKDSEYYNVFSYYDSKWYTAHEKHRFENIEITNTKIYSDNHFSAHISLNHIVTLNGKDIDNKLNYTIYFIKDNDKWLCTSILLE